MAKRPAEFQFTASEVDTSNQNDDGVGGVVVEDVTTATTAAPVDMDLDVEVSDSLAKLQHSRKRHRGESATLSTLSTEADEKNSVTDDTSSPDGSNGICDDHVSKQEISTDGEIADSQPKTGTKRARNNSCEAGNETDASAETEHHLVSAQDLSTVESDSIISTTVKFPNVSEIVEETNQITETLSERFTKSRQVESVGNTDVTKSSRIGKDTTVSEDKVCDPLTLDNGTILCSHDCTEAPEKDDNDETVIDDGPNQKQKHENSMSEELNKADGVQNIGEAPTEKNRNYFQNANDKNLEPTSSHDQNNRIMMQTMGKVCSVSSSKSQNSENDGGSISNVGRVSVSNCKDNEEQLSERYEGSSRISGEVKLTATATTGTAAAADADVAVDGGVKEGEEHSSSKPDSPRKSFNAFADIANSKSSGTFLSSALVAPQFSPFDAGTSLPSSAQSTKLQPPCNRLDDLTDRWGSGVTAALDVDSLTPSSRPAVFPGEEYETVSFAAANISLFKLLPIGEDRQSAAKFAVQPSASLSSLASVSSSPSTALSEPSDEGEITTNSTATNSTVTNSTTTNSTATDSTATNSATTNSTATNSIATNSTTTNSTATNSINATNAPPVTEKNEQNCEMNDQRSPQMKFRKQGEGILNVLTAKESNSVQEGSDDSCRSEPRIVIRQKGTWQVLLNSPLAVSSRFIVVDQLTSGFGVKFVGLDSTLASGEESESTMTNTAAATTRKATPSKCAFGAFCVKFSSDFQRNAFLDCVKALRPGP